LFVLAIDVQLYQYQSTMSHLTQLTLINDTTLFTHAQLVILKATGPPSSVDLQLVCCEALNK